MDNDCIRTPLKMQMLLHYYAIAEPYAIRQPEHANSVAVREQTLELIHQELLIQDSLQESGYSVTEKGKAFIAYVMDMPLPIKAWAMKF